MTTPSPLPSVHPLTQALQHITATDEQVYADIGTLDAEWFPAARMCDPQSPLLDSALIHQAKDYPQMDARTRGSYLIGDYSWYVPFAAIATYLAYARVPDFSFANVALRLRTYTYTWGKDSPLANQPYRLNDPKD